MHVEVKGTTMATFAFMLSLLLCGMMIGLLVVHA
jgi:hypothetical protein